MRSTVKLYKIVFALFLLSPILSNAQKEKIGVDKVFTFDENNKTKSFTFNVAKGTKEIKINFEGNISTGGLKVKIMDPDGNQVSGFSLETSKSKTKSTNYSYSSNSDERSRNRNERDCDEDRARSRSSARSSSSSSSRSSSRAVSVEINDSDSVITETKIRNTHIYTNQKTETGNAGARGVINKEITNPTEGVWKFTVYPDDTSGHLVAKITYK